MKINLRWQLLIAAVGFALALALLFSRQPQPASVAPIINPCTTRVPAVGGTFIEGIVGAPQFLNPLLSDGFPVDEAVSSLIFDGLTRYDESGILEPNLAEGWTVSEDGLTVEFQLRQDVTWHDGEPFSADDVLFTYHLLQDDTFTGAADLKRLWQSVVVSKTGPYSIQIDLPAPYAPFLDATTRGILPKHLLEGVTAVSLPAHPFNRNPTGTGPFIIAPNQDWERTHQLNLTPNPAYWRGGTQITALEFRFYPNETAMFDAYAAGNIQAINQVSQTLLPRVAAQPGTRLFTTAEPRYTELLFNLTDSGAAALQETDVRRALAYALDREMLIDEELNGQGLLQDGPYLPSNWASNPALITVYAHQVISATAILDQAGWTIPDGATIRYKEDAPLNLRLVTLDASPQKELAAGIKKQWAAVNAAVDISLAESPQELRDMLAAREFDVALVDIAPTGDPDLYDFWSQEAIVRGQNYGGWNNRRASEALENGRNIWPIEERRPFYNTFLRQYDNDLPAITLYQHTYTYALSRDVHNAEIGLIVHPRDRFQTFATWFLLFQDVTIECPTQQP